MSDSTSILDLPTDPIGGGNVSNNISLSASENVPNNVHAQSQSNGISLDQSVISQIVSGLQQASITGATQLPSRDIPMNTSGLNIDAQIQPNYVPPPPPTNRDYINEYQESSEIVDNYNKGIQRNNSLDDMYNEIQTPLLLAVLYFLFQLPFFRKFLFNYFPIIFSNDGNLNINGFLFTSSLFGLTFYLVNKITYQFGAF
jgi:hypothetical protein